MSVCGTCSFKFHDSKGYSQLLEGKGEGLNVDYDYFFESQNLTLQTLSSQRRNTS